MRATVASIPRLFAVLTLVLCFPGSLTLAVDGATPLPSQESKPQPQSPLTTPATAPACCVAPSVVSPTPTMQIIDVIAKAVIGFGGLALSFAVYWLSRRQRAESWLRAFNDMHHEFWSDRSYATVREWLACQQSYWEVAPILKKRRDSPLEVTPQDYSKLENLDKFLNLMSRIVNNNPEFQKQGRVWRDLFLKYWLEECTKEKSKGASVVPGEVLP